MPQLSNNQQLRQLANLELLARQVVEGFITGLHQSPFHGFSVEFAEHRLYNSGESVKNIDWKLLARTDKLFVKQFEEETNLRCYLLLDTSSSMNFPPGGTSKLEFSIYAIASLMYLFKKQRDAFGLCIFSDKMDWISQARSTSAHLFYLFAELEKAFAAPKQNTATNITQTLHFIANEIHQRSMVIIFSDMMENSMNADKAAELFAALQHLKYRKHEVMIFNVIAPGEERDLNFDNRPHHFIDMETGKEVRVQPGLVRDSYREAVAAYRQQLHLKCAQYGIQLIDADIDKGYQAILRSFLIKRNSMI
ncbi:MULTISPECIES: DUF58 domain-containing protein [unclassified Mucilaginibacter]|uniref:DUF58 domain-containing protein n=1 Tax=unclassified Mucilaginibacter TaxID=2617802 RepID=UPI000966AE93|nr:MULTISPECIES: DUF58 domain-containing protein [unclassified Mucilaginibacter]OJW13806.1 MAG: hypothetical protein BGO48_03545 [Mucilaginibacter sp. 44-25]PLW88274.1 MAG: DUF58 domain-containing protein [Mucilaginibacter sp.]HEK22267.1 DUF58 domain-containing protein [Bacteroidota bacterium]